MIPGKGPILPLLNDMLRAAVKEKKYITGNGFRVGNWYNQLQSDWGKYEDKIGRGCPCTKTVAKFFQFKPEATYNRKTVNGFCWVLLGCSYEESIARVSEGKTPEATSFSSNKELSHVLQNLTSGIWLSRFTFQRKDSERAQYNLEYFKLSEDKFIGENILGASSTNQTPYIHELTAELCDNYLLGIWRNVNSRHFGCFQFYVLSRGTTMTGRYFWNKDDNSVGDGVFQWVKVKALWLFPEGQIAELRTRTLRSFSYLDEHFQTWFDTGDELSLEQLLENQEEAKS
ncbi:hypothetical protein H6G00_21870 [Leptolyngbya sp. FACHB-541]|uniref:hypothetical protein n=1 Tax=Leptolyngbya sp. FACHB-541 TaxID=2692810 RepID=UPI001686493B|nr:hypothetical protein [Leptolyngbya sp. FACHB-541]MBD1999229.1 hypothetical protein [Leptolyngbya sp. FACHB-541]